MAADWVPRPTSRSAAVRETITERFPIIASREEFGVTGSNDAPASWLIDPVDGTTNYVHGLPLSTFSLWRLRRGRAAVALVADPYRGEVLSAVRGAVQRNNNPTRVSARDLMGCRDGYQAQSIWQGMAGVMHARPGGCDRIMGSNAFSISAGCGPLCRDRDQLQRRTASARR